MTGVIIRLNIFISNRGHLSNLGIFTNAGYKFNENQILSFTVEMMIIKRQVEIKLIK